MNNENFDEYQIMTRQKVAFQTLMLTLALIFLNGLIKEQYIWASPMIESLILICIPTMYFTTVSLFKNAYLSMKEKNANSRIVIFGLMGSFSLVLFLFFNKKEILYNGCLQNKASQLILAFFFLYLAAIMIINKCISLRSDEQER